MRFVVLSVFACVLACFGAESSFAQQVSASAPASEAPGAAAHVCTPPADSQLHVPLRGQEASNWCWAASAQMILEYLGQSGNEISQCSQANKKHFTDKNCCDNPVPKECDEPEWPDFASFRSPGGGPIQFLTTSNAPLAQEKVKELLAPKDPNNPCSFTPFAFTWRYTGTGGHMMVATGYKVVNGQLYVEVNNPLEVNKGSTQELTYERYVSSPTYTHWNDYYGFH